MLLVYKQINSYYFTNDYEKEIENFISELNNYLYNHNTLTANEIQDNFRIIIDNFQHLMEYFGIDDNWNIRNIYVPYKLNMSLIKNTKKYIARTLELGIANKEYTNIIFEFHRYAPLTQPATQIYKFLINTILYSTKENNIYKQAILSLYLGHAIIYNNFDAIKILIEEYHVSPITTWPQLPNEYKHLELKIMPLIQTIHNVPEEKIIKFFYTNKQHQEQNFIFMLSKINFNKEHIKSWQIQEIFKYTFTNYFTQAMNYLLEQNGFCKKLKFTREELIILAFSKLFINQYNQLINIIFTHHNVLNNSHINIEDIKQQVEHYINILNNMLTFNENCQNLDHIVLKIILEFTKTYLTNNYATNQELLFEHQQQSEQLILQNRALLQSNELLQQQLMSSLDCLQRSNSAIRTLQFKASPTNARSINQLQIELNKNKLELQTTKQQYENLLYTYKLLLNRTSHQATSSGITTIDFNKYIYKQYNYPLKKSYSFYL